MKKKAPTNEILESESTWLGEKTEISGDFRFKGTVRVFGILKGEVRCQPGSELIIMPSGVVEGKIHGDRVIVAGFASGEIHTTGKVLVASSGRVTGKIVTPSLQVEFGAILEGETAMPEKSGSQ